MYYDFILGKSLANNYIQGMYTSRFEEPQELTSYPQLVSVLLRELGKASNELQVVPEVIDAILRGLTVFDNKYKKGIEVDIIDSNLREMFACASFNGYEIYLVKRPDIKVWDEVLPETRAYMIDKNDLFYPTLHRVATGTSLVFDIPQEASIADVVMTFSKMVTFGSTTEDFVGLSKYQENYDSLALTHSSWTMDVRKIQTFFNDYGYNFFVVI